MTNYYSTTLDSKNIQQIHRGAIAMALKKGDSVSEIARNLGFSRQSIHNEIKRGTVQKLDSLYNTYTTYDAYKAQSNADRCSHYKGRLLKIDDIKGLQEFIESKIKDKYSPEVIENEIKKAYEAGEFSNKICFKTIYNLIEGKKLNVSSEDLIYGQKRHKKAHKQEKMHEKPNGGESIELRNDISDREEFGHWEIDCVVGHREGKSTSLMTLVERKTRFGITVLIPRKNKKSIVNALKKIKSKFGKYFYDIFKTITADNGCEFKDAQGMSLALKCGKKVKIYFAHAYHSWERGSNENFNRMIRRYYPKGTDFCKITNKELQIVIDKINNYPRKQFGFESSLSKFNTELSKIYSLTITI